MTEQEKQALIDRIKWAMEQSSKMVIEKKKRLGQKMIVWNNGNIRTIDFGKPETLDPKDLE